MTADGVWAYTYDDTGAVTGKSKSGEAWSYTYDLNGQMTSASKSATVGGAVTDSVSCAYDAWGNRVSRTQSGTTSSTERYVVDGWDTAKPGATGTENFDTTIDLDGSNAVTARRVFGAGFDDAVARRDSSGAVSWYGADGLGSVRQVFDNSGSVTGSRTFDGFGNVASSSGTGLDRYGYTGTVTDPLTGLVGDNARSYDPTTGRWMSQDPIGFAAGDVNLYRYVGNGPTHGTDPSGLEDPLNTNAGYYTPAEFAKAKDLIRLLKKLRDADVEDHLNKINPGRGRISGTTIFLGPAYFEDDNPEIVRVRGELSKLTYGKPLPGEKIYVSKITVKDLERLDKNEMAAARRAGEVEVERVRRAQQQQFYRKLTIMFATAPLYWCGEPMLGVGLGTSIWRVGLGAAQKGVAPRLTGSAATKVPAVASKVAPATGGGVRVSAQDAVNGGLVRRGGQTEAILKNAEAEFATKPPCTAQEAFDMLDRAAKKVDPGLAAGVPADLQPIVAGQDKLLLNNNGIKTLLKADGEIIVTDRNGQVIQHLVPPK